MDLLEKKYLEFSVFSTTKTKLNFVFFFKKKITITSSGMEGKGSFLEFSSSSSIVDSIGGFWKIKFF